MMHRIVSVCEPKIIKKMPVHRFSYVVPNKVYMLCKSLYDIWQHGKLNVVVHNILHFIQISCITFWRRTCSPSWKAVYWEQVSRGGCCNPWSLYLPLFFGSAWTAQKLKTGARNTLFTKQRDRPTIRCAKSSCLTSSLRKFHSIASDCRFLLKKIDAKNHNQPLLSICRRVLDMPVCKLGDNLWATYCNRRNVSLCCSDWQLEWLRKVSLTQHM